MFPNTDHFARCQNFPFHYCRMNQYRYPIAARRRAGRSPRGLVLTALDTGLETWSVTEIR
jgi:hypothetical protein